MCLSSPSKTYADIRALGFSYLHFPIWYLKAVDEVLASGSCLLLLVDLLTQTGLEITMAKISAEGPEGGRAKAVLIFVM